MRIIGGHDYYDSAMAFGRDTETVFVRHKKDSNKQKLEWQIPDIEENSYYGDEVYFPIVVYFCDTIYRGVRYDKRNNVYPYRETIYIWKSENIDPKKLRERRSWYYKPTPSGWLLNRDTIEEYFTPKKMNETEINRMVDSRIAIAYYEWNNQNYDFHVNEEGLKDIGFQRVIDPWTAFQELSMWVGGVLPKSGNPMVEIEDNKMKIAKAGFDNKVSFRHPIKLERN